MRGDRSKRMFGLVAATAACALASLVVAGTAGAYSIWPLAGSGSPCAAPPSCGDGGLATRSQVSYPIGVAVDKSGNVLIADWGDNEVRRLSTSGTVTTVAGGGTTCSKPPACGDGGPATGAELTYPDGVAVDRSGNVYVADTLDDEVRKISPAGTITRFAGNGAACAGPPGCGDGGPATTAQLRSPYGLAVDRSGNVYVADAGDNEIREVTPAGKISRLAGTGATCSKPPSCGDGGPATNAQLNFPAGVAVDRAGDVYVADDGDNEVRKISSAGTIARIAGSGAACGSPPSCGDGGPAVNATLGMPDGVAVDLSGNVVVADDLDNEVRKISAAGMISRIGGNGTACGVPAGCGNGGSAASAQLNYPDAVAVDPLGDVYVGDTFDSQLRLLSPRAGKSVQTSSGAAGVLALESIVSRGSVKVRYLLSLAAPVTLSVTPRRGRPTVVVRAPGHPGAAVLAWNRRIDGAPAGRGRYKLTVTATVGSTSVTSSTSVRL